ncbi:hypothetical protein NL676_008223 [Syzygium grande]|nr:hypothetical protein NL676_008223 [Syzygium grande]
MPKHSPSKSSPFFMETSALEALNVENGFMEVLTQMYRMVSRKALNIGDDPTALPKGQTINLGTWTMSQLSRKPVVARREKCWFGCKSALLFIALCSP